MATTLRDWLLAQLARPDLGENLRNYLTTLLTIEENKARKATPGP